MIELSLGCARVVFTDRHGGVSVAPFDSMNLAGHVGDDPDAVAENHRILRAARARRAGTLGAAVPRARHATCSRVDRARRRARRGRRRARRPRRAAARRDGRGLRADRARERHRGRGDPRGWRGALGGVVEAGVAAVRELGNGPVRAAIGPCICVRHYEFGADALVPLVARFGDVGRGHAPTTAMPRSTSRRAAGRAATMRASTRSPTRGAARSSRRTTSRTGVTAAPGARGRRGEAAVSRPRPIADALAEVRERIARGRATRGSRPGRRPAHRRVEDRGRRRGWPRRSTRGLTDLGENRAQELLAKAPVLADARTRRRPGTSSASSSATRSPAWCRGCSAGTRWTGSRSARRSPGAHRAPGSWSR